MSDQDVQNLQQSGKSEAVDESGEVDGTAVNQKDQPYQDQHRQGGRGSDKDTNATYGSGLAGAGGTPEDYRLRSDGDEQDERTGDTNISDSDLTAGDAPIAGEQGKGRGTTQAGVAGSGGDAGVNAPSSTSSIVAGDTTTAGGDTPMR